MCITTFRLLSFRFCQVFLSASICSLKFNCSLREHRRSAGNSSGRLFLPLAVLPSLAGSSSSRSQQVDAQRRFRVPKWNCLEDFRNFYSLFFFDVSASLLLRFSPLSLPAVYVSVDLFITGSSRFVLLLVSSIADNRRDVSPCAAG